MASEAKLSEASSESKYSEEQHDNGNYGDYDLGNVIDLKRELVTLINNERKETISQSTKPSDALLPPLVLDPQLSSVADLHCQEMAQAGHESHWNLKGEAPYYRYGKKGINYHVREYIYSQNSEELSTSVVQALSANGSSQEVLLNAMFDAHNSCKRQQYGTGWDDDDPELGDRQEQITNQLMKEFTHIGIGLYLTENRFRFIEVFTSKQLNLIDDQLSDIAANQETRITVNVNQDMGQAGEDLPTVPYAAVVYYAPPNIPIPLAELKKLNRQEPYPEVPEELLSVTWPWELKLTPNPSETEMTLASMSMLEGTIPLQLESAINADTNSLKEGVYYVQVFVSKDPKGVSFTEAMEDVDVPLAGDFEDIICSIGKVFTYPTNLDELNSRELPIGPIQDIGLLSPGQQLPAGYAFRTKSGDDAPRAVYKCGTGGPVIVEVVIAMGEHDVPPSFEVVPELTTTVVPVSSESKTQAPEEKSESKQEQKDSEESQTSTKVEVTRKPADLRKWMMQNEDGEEKNALPSEPVYLCVRKSTDPVEVKSRGLFDICLVQPSYLLDPSDDAEYLNRQLAAFDRLDIGNNLEIHFQSGQRVDEVVNDGAQQIVDQENDGWGDVQGVDGNDGSDNDVTFGVTIDGDDGRDGTSDAQGRRQELQLAEQAAQSARIEQMLEEAKVEHARLIAENAELQKKIVPMMSKRQQQQKQSSASGSIEDNKKDSNDTVSRVEQEKAYRSALKSVNDARVALHHSQAGFDKIAMDLQTKLDEKETKALEIRNSFVQFKREIAKAAENSRTGKPIPRRIITQFEETEATKDSEVERVRLKHINLRTQLRKLESTLREKEQLAEGLHLIDFEQLKIENQTLNEKIEERNEELHKLRKKTTATVQVLTHIKEKLQFVQAETTVLNDQLEKVDGDLAVERDTLTQLKHIRDSNRSNIEAKKLEQGFINSTALVKDYEERKHYLSQLRNQLLELQERYHNLQ